MKWINGQRRLRRKAAKWLAASFGVFLLVAAVQAKPAVIVHKGRSSYVIVTPDDETPAVNYAARELQDFVRQMTGVELPVLAEKKAGRKPAFLLGPCRRSAKAGLVEQARSLQADGVLIKTTCRCRTG